MSDVSKYNDPQPTAHLRFTARDGKWILQQKYHWYIEVTNSMRPKSVEEWRDVPLAGESVQV